jgi:hypothetical protein
MKCVEERDVTLRGAKGTMTDMVPFPVLGY